MIVIFFALAGGVIGSVKARKRGGNKKDIAQYAAGYAFAFLIMGMFLTVFIDRITR